MTGGTGESPILLTTGPVTEQVAAAELDAATRARTVNDWAAGVADTLAWLVGLLSRPPLDVPRRHPDGRVVTWRDLADEAEAAWPLTWEPEQRAETEHAARRDAARHQGLADLAALAID